jgi:hypothetical protein
MVENLLRQILAAGIESGAFPEQDIATTVSLVNACLSNRNLPEAGPDRDRAIESTVVFVLRAVGTGDRITTERAEEAEPALA